MKWKELSETLDFCDRCEALGYEVEFNQDQKCLMLRDETGTYRFKPFITPVLAYNVVKENSVTLPYVLDRVLNLDEESEDEN